MRVPKLIVAGFLAVNLLLIAACVFALRQSVKLRTAIDNYQVMLTPARGSRVPPLVGEDRQGNPQTISYGEDRRPTIIYTFSKECHACQENWQAMRSLQSLAPSRLRIVYVDPLLDVFAPEYLSSSGIGQSTLLIHLSPAAAYVYDARAIPQLLLVDYSGRVQWSHVGELASGDLSEVVSLVRHD
jgi:hypothetical protein